MWWTAITLAGIAAWFEWTYRRSRKAKREEKNPPAAPETPNEEELEQAKK